MGSDVDAVTKSGRLFHTRAAATEWWVAGMVICLERGADLHMAQLMPLPLTVSCFSKIQTGLPLWYRLTWVVPDKGPLNGCVCVCVCFCLHAVLPGGDQRSGASAVYGRVPGRSGRRRRSRRRRPAAERWAPVRRHADTPSLRRRHRNDA